MAEQKPPDGWKMVSVGEALPKAAQEELVRFVNEFRAGKVKPDEIGSVRLQLRARVLEPWRQELEGTWDLDYLSYALGYALGLPL